MAHVLIQLGQEVWSKTSLELGASGMAVDVKGKEVQGRRSKISQLGCLGRGGSRGWSRVLG